MKTIQIETTIKATLEKVWECWTKPEHVTAWNQASNDWHCPKAENDLRTGGKFSYTMAAKDGSSSFDFGGVYTSVVPMKRIEYVLGDERKVVVTFEDLPSEEVKIKESFEMESENSEELQRSGWQAILDNFKKYVEG